MNIEIKDPVLAVVDFDLKLKTYWYLNVAFLMFVTLAGWITLPFWLLGWGQWWTKRHHENLRCELRSKSLFFSKGIFFRTEKTIPLNKIQDLTLKEGPLLKALGICSLGVETAGSAGTQAGHDMTLIGVVNPRAFRDEVLRQRDQLEHQDMPSAKEAPESSTNEILGEIRDSLLRIESQLRETEDK